MGKARRTDHRICIVVPSLKDRLVEIKGLAADPANTRVHDERSLEAIRGSLQRFGQQKPVVIDTRGVVIAGNGTLEAARQLGWTHIAAVRSDLDGVERVAYAIADNRTAELSAWDDGALRLTLGAMPADAAMAAGYTQDELAELLTVRGDEPIVEDAPPALLPAAVTRTGDLWELDTHRLLCGDSTACR